jgi:beta-lactamase class A
MARLAGLISTVMLVTLAGALAQHSTPTFEHELRRVLDRKLAVTIDALDGVVGYAALDLTSGEEFGRLEQQAFPTASTIKLAILYELFRQADEGRMALDTSAPLDRSQVVGGTGILQALGTPTLTLRDHAVLMMSISDNTSTNVLIDRLGLPAIASRMQSLGLGGIRVRRKMMDSAAAQRGEENVAAPREIVRLLRVLDTGEALKPESKAAVLKVLAVGSGGYIRRGIAPGVDVLSKSGELEGVRVDAAIVRAKNRAYALSIMTTYLKDEAEGERAIADLSRAFYEYFSRLGFGSEFGRQIKRPI